ncbi:hypothetical protein EV426DRAFT_437414 [Tirmania nivea]|nr:hypothetical protein EV426DRAFT_437414 [Tirmania nivea]
MVYDAGEDLMDLLEELSEVYKIIAARRYIAARKISAGRHLIFQGPSVLENLIKNYPDSAFLNLFRMHRSSFWALVDIVTPMWPVIAMTKKRPRPIYQQLAVALYTLGSVGGGGLERLRIAYRVVCRKFFFRLSQNCSLAGYRTLELRDEF